MRRYLIPALILTNVALAGGLAWRWVTPDGQLRDVRWIPPAPIKPVLTDSVFPPWSADLGSFMAALDRPLFSATRKPPPKPSEAAAVVVDTLDSVRVLGLYSTGGTSGGAIVRSEGKVVRLKQGDTLSGWTVKEVRPRELVMARGADQRTLDVKMGPDLAADVPGTPGGGAAAGNQNAPMSAQRRVEQEAANSNAAVNALRARAGMPPIP